MDHTVPIYFSNTKIRLSYQSYQWFSFEKLKIVLTFLMGKKKLKSIFLIARLDLEAVRMLKLYKSFITLSDHGSSLFHFLSRYLHLLSTIDLESLLNLSPCITSENLVEFLSVFMKLDRNIIQFLFRGDGVIFVFYHMLRRSNCIPFSARTVHRRQNLTSIDVRFWVYRRSSHWKK